ncbi:MAG: hypothetical protein AAGJ10_04740 [Bacteroidota bacterium]
MYPISVQTPVSRFFIGFLFGAVMVFATTHATAQPIQQHPDNPSYFLWRGLPTALITSAEHYGAVVNLDFDYATYLATLEAEGMNYTRIFSGAYIEPAGAFGIAENTLAPAEGRYLSPWARSDAPGYAGGGNKLDLDRFSEAYLSRLRDFIATAARHGVVVELTFFSSTYSEAQWGVHPFNPANNIQGFGVEDWRQLHARSDGPAFGYQQQLVAHLVRALNDFDNLFYEIQNEPWSDSHTMGPMINRYLRDEHKWPNAVEIPTPASVAWQAAMAEVIATTEASLPKQHLIAQGIANFEHAVADGEIIPHVSLLNFHYANPNAVRWNQGLGYVLGYDESGFAGRADATYRGEAWRFIMSGGGLFNNLDYSFTVDHPDGTYTEPNGHGGGSVALRRQLRTLSEFIHGFDLTTLQPDHDVVLRAPGLIPYALSDGRDQYGIYLEGRRSSPLVLGLSAGAYQLTWLNPVTGSQEQARLDVPQANMRAELVLPDFEDAIVLRVMRLQR